MSDLLNTLRSSLRDHYDVQRELGEGAMATVYLATDKKHDRQVAIKVLKPDLAASVGHDRFLREIDIAAKLQHPNILPVYDSGQAGSLLYYVMPYVAGETLRDRMTGDKIIPSVDAIQIAREVAAALDYAHTQGIVHRDIKPANILLSQGHAQVADFGIARAISVSGGAGLTQAGMAVGTPWYMSPEQSLGEADVDGRADVYALGCVLYEMLAGKPPYEGPTPQSVIAKSLSGDIPRLESDETGLQSVITKAIAKEKTDRFQTAGELEAALRAPTTVAPPPAQPKRLMIGVAAALLVIVAGAFALWPRGPSFEGDPRKSLVIFPFENKTGDPANDYLQDASMNLIGLAVSHWEDMRVFDDERTGSLLRRHNVDGPSDIDFDAARDMAREARVGTFILGDIRREQDSLAVEAKVHDVQSGDRLATEIVRTSLSADPRPLFDSLAVRILQVSGAPPGERPGLITQTTRSLDAYRAYLAGMEFLQRFEIDSSRSALTRAVELDSTFALAYIGLRNVIGWAGLESDPALQRVMVAKAEAHSASLPPRLKKLVQFHSAYEANQLGRARQLAEELIAHDSTDVEAWYQLGEAHYHDRPSRPPKEDDPNIGKALVAFRRSVSLDPSYVLAYRHITDVLGTCAANPRILCLADSAVYGSPEELEAQFGADEVDRINNEAAEARITAAFDWVAESPNSMRARIKLVELLVDAERHDEARSQLEVLRVEGPGYVADIWLAWLDHIEGDYAQAAAHVESASEPGENGIRLLVEGFDPNNVIRMILGGGRVDAASAFTRGLLAAMPGDSISEVFGHLVPKRLVMQFVAAGAIAEIGGDSTVVNLAAQTWIDSIESHYQDQPDRLQSVLATSGSVILASYLGARDTTLLSRFLARVDTTGSRTWRTMLAHLALERGDTSTARARLDAHYSGHDELEFSGEPGKVRVFAYGDLLARLGRYREAITAFEILDDSVRSGQHPGLHVRSWAERGALYQQLGQPDKAIEMYEKFIAAWRDGDETVQPMVDRARAAVASLRGETATTERR